MKILVTGGAGFVGSHIVDYLIENNFEVVVIDNLSSGNKNFLNSKAIFYNADIIKDTSYIFEKEKPVIVIHCAAQVMLRKSIEEPVFDANTNIIGTINILENCRKFGVKKIIYTSTGGARYGNPKEIPVAETAKINPESPYGASKHTAEHYIQIYSNLYNIDYLIFCFGNVYGPRDNPKSGRVIAVFIDKMLSNEVPVIFGDGKQTRDFVFVKDLAKFIVDNINEKPKHKLFNIANGKQISVNEIADLLKKSIDFKKEIKHVSEIKGEIKDIYLDTSRASKELGWSPKTPFEEGLKETIKWREENK